MPLLIYILLLVSVAWNAAAGDEGVSPVFRSPNGIYTVTTAVPKGADGRPDYDNYALVIARKGRPISQNKEMGTILDVHWSPDGKYVAVNYHNANSGDYAWVFSLPDGAVIKRPFDKLPMEDETKWYPKYAKYEGYKEWMLVTGWTRRGELKLRRDSLYKNVKNYLQNDFTAIP